jgi:hypothetical protein
MTQALPPGEETGARTQERVSFRRRPVHKGADHPIQCDQLLGEKSDVWRRDILPRHEHHLRVRPIAPNQQGAKPELTHCMSSKDLSNRHQSGFGHDILHRAGVQRDECMRMWLKEAELQQAVRTGLNHPEQLGAKSPRFAHALAVLHDIGIQSDRLEGFPNTPGFPFPLSGERKMLHSASSAFIHPFTEGSDAIRRRGEQLRDDAMILMLTAPVDANADPLPGKSAMDEDRTSFRRGGDPAPFHVQALYLNVAGGRRRCRFHGVI